MSNPYEVANLNCISCLTNAKTELQGIQYLTAARLNGYTPVALNPEEIVEGIIAFFHDLENISEKLNRLITRPGLLDMYF